ncbi:hypothetical protein G6F43_010850 [Rhizopus delemar]|nr:hypothetical protein G6F43_010850 [Rhizopus delemar]
MQFQASNSLWSPHCGLVCFSALLLFSNTKYSVCGRVISTKVTHVHGAFDPVTITVVHAPAGRRDRFTFLEELAQNGASLLPEFGSSRHILLGDLNYTYATHISSSAPCQAPSSWLSYIDSCFIDCVTDTDCSPMATFSRGSSCSCIDYIFGTTDMFECRVASDVTYIQPSWSDHFLLTSHFTFRSPTHAAILGKGVWRAHPRLAFSETFQALVAHTIFTTVSAFDPHMSPQDKWDKVKTSIAHSAKSFSRRDIATKVFGDRLLNDLSASLRASSMDYSMDLPAQVYITFASMFADLAMGSATCDDTIVKLIVEGAGLDYGPRRLLRGIANLIQKLPSTPVNVKNTSETALWSTYFDPILSTLLSGPDRNMHLQWSNSAPTERGSARPDAAIYHKQQGSFVGSRGYGEAKPEGTSTHDISVDFLRLAVFCKNSIDVSLLDSTLAFQINNFTITFYLQQLTARGIYASFEIARITFPRSLEGIPAFFNLHNIRLLLAVNKVFWHKCVVSGKPATIAHRYCQTIPNWQKNIRTQQDSQRTPSLRIEQ